MLLRLSRVGLVSFLWMATLALQVHSSVIPRSSVATIPEWKAMVTVYNQKEDHSLSKRNTPLGMPTTCLSDFDCLQTTRPDNWPREHATLQTGNYACVKTNPSQPGFCQFVVTAGTINSRLSVRSFVRQTVDTLSS